MSGSGQSSRSAGGDTPLDAGKETQQRQEVEVIDDEEEDSESDIGEDEYIVEEIVNHKIVNKNVLYEVVWVGYDEHSWEPKANLDGCPQKLQAYWDEIGGEPKPTIKKKRGRPVKHESNGSSKRRKSSPAQSETPKPTGQGRGAQKRGAASNARTDNQHQSSCGKTYSLPAGSWEEAILRIQSVWEQEPSESLSGKTVLIARVLLNEEFDYAQFDFRTMVLYSKAPCKLLEFYESNLQFQQAAVPVAKSVTSDAASDSMQMNEPSEEENGSIRNVEHEDDDNAIKDVASV